MAYGIITVPVTDLRAEPHSRAERLSQALFGASIRLRDRQHDFVQVVLADGYTGWCRAGHCERVNHTVWKRYAAQPKYLIRSPIVSLIGTNRAPVWPYQLYFGTRLAIEKLGSRADLVLPNGFHAPIRLRDLVLPSPIPVKVTGEKIIALARRFLGTPYLWGGITVCGIDCSGLVQAVFVYSGIPLPRDSKDQILAGQAVDRSAIRKGDLLFFPGHVAISCGGDEFIHASAGRGMVTIDSFNRKAPNYRADLDHGFREARRVLP